MLPEVSFLDDNLSPLRWERDALLLLDQKALPREERWLRITTFEAVADAIRDLTVRGAPAIGCAAAYGVALGARQIAAGAKVTLDDVFEILAATRPTAVNLFWALERMRRALPSALLDEALAIQAEDIVACRRIGELGAPLLPEGGVLTHCNAGALATGGYGTALGVIRSAVSAKKQIRVFCDETRPVLQGSRLTAWELIRTGIDTTLICDNMAASMMARGEIHAVVVGADRIAANGDVANKIGTYGVALAAAAHRLPMIVAAPWSTVDLRTRDGAAIPIEERSPHEVTHHATCLLAPPDVKVRNPAFDVTPAALVTAIVTERGVARPPFGPALQALSPPVGSGG
jgi:methylthioribose-1-phosphate isomerase